VRKKSEAVLTRKRQLFGEKLIVLLTLKLVRLCCALFGAPWRSPGGSLAAGVRNVEAVSSRDFPDF
jgi:hypothetical protein